MLNKQIAAGYITGKAFVVDGAYGSKTAAAAAAYWKKKGWTTAGAVWGVGTNTVKALQR